MRNKTAMLMDYICDLNADLYAMTETWLTENDASVRVELIPDGYNLLDQPRVGRRGGGTGLLYRNDLRVKKVESGEENSFEFSEWIICSTGHDIRLFIIYRPPYSDEHQVPTSVFFTEFSEYLESAVLSKENLLISGDFNIHVDNIHDSDAIKFSDLLESFGLKQHVTGPTHKDGHTLDLIVTRCSDCILSAPPKVDCYLSDHASVCCMLASQRPPLLDKTITFRKYKGIDLGSFKRDLNSSSLCQSTPSVISGEGLDELARDYNNTISALVDRHAPLKSKRVRSRPSVPWYTAEINAAKKLRRKAERHWRRTGLHEDFAAFKAQRNRVTYLMNVARKEFYTDFIAENSSDQGKLFRAAKKLLAKKEVPSFPEYVDNSALVNDIGRYFIRKINTIRSGIDATSDPSDGALLPDDPVVGPNKQLWEFRSLDEGQVSELIQKCSKKSCPSDPAPTSLVVSCLDELLPVITCLINGSMKIGYYPCNWKEGLVIPLLKSAGLLSDFKNLRPISNLQYISKLTERAVFEQMHAHMTNHSLYPLLQSAYRLGHSTETALLKVHNDLLMNMDAQRVTLLVLLDLSAAFDTVDHEVLLNRLRSSFGIRGTVLRWFISYLSNRWQRVSFNQEVSERFDLTCGVPQGSCLGPLLFTIYASKIFEIIKEYLPQAHAYADDTQLYLSFKADSSTAQNDAMKAMENCITAIRAWMIKDKLCLNDSKTEFMIVGTRQQLAKVNIDQLCVGESSIVPVTSVKNLGSWFDKNMSMTTHIIKVCKAASFHLYNIRRIRKYLTSESTHCLVRATVISRIDYCNSLLFKIPAVHIAKLQRIQNSAARLVYYIPRFEHITPVLYRLHWLPVPFRIEYKVLILTYKAIHGYAPLYISDLIRTGERTNYNLRSSSQLLLQPYNATKTKKTLGDRAFQVASPGLWNGLPNDIRNAKTMDVFKSLVKTHLFRKAYACYFF